METFRVSGADDGNFPRKAICWDLMRQMSEAKHSLPRRFDLSGCVHLKPYSIACICAIGCLAKQRRQQPQLELPTNSECRDHIVRIGLGQFFELEKSDQDIVRDTNVVARQVTHPASAADDAMDAWERSFGSMSAGVKPELANHLDEIIHNALGHSSSEIGAVMVGQAFPKTRCIDVSIVDLGVTIKGHLCSNNAYSAIASDADAIEKATQDGVTGTPPGKKNLLGNPNSGAGLHALRTYCESGGGELTLVSGSAYICYRRANSPQTVTLHQPFPGCLVNVRFFPDFSLPIEENQGIVLR